MTEQTDLGPKLKTASLSQARTCIEVEKKVDAIDPFLSRANTSTDPFVVDELVLY